MTRFRFAFLVMALLALSACDNPESTTTAPHEPAKPAVAIMPAAPADAAPVAAPKPLTTPQREPARPIPRPAVVNKPAAKDPAAKDPVASAPLKADLDLSLPPEVFAELQSLVAPDQASSPALLPPLFRAEEASESPFQLNGKLITNERGDDYWDSLEGAELQFEFKR